MHELFVFDNTRAWLGEQCSLKRKRMTANNPEPQ
jgi:hypothetical protein